MLGCEGPVREQFSACSGIWALSLGATRLAFSDLPGTAKPVASICCKGPPLQTSKSNAVALFDFLEAPFYRRFRGASSEPISRPGPRNAAAGVPVRPRAPQPGPICTGSSVKPAGSEKVLRFGLEMSLCEPEMYPPQDPKKAKPCPACVCEAKMAKLRVPQLGLLQIASPAAGFWCPFLSPGSQTPLPSVSVRQRWPNCGVLWLASAAACGPAAGSKLTKLKSHRSILGIGCKNASAAARPKTIITLRPK